MTVVGELDCSTDCPCNLIKLQVACFREKGICFADGWDENADMQGRAIWHELAV